MHSSWSITHAPTPSFPELTLPLYLVCVNYNFFGLLFSFTLPSHLAIYCSLPVVPASSPFCAGDPPGQRTARQARHAISALLSHALPPCRQDLLLSPYAGGPQQPPTDATVWITPPATPVAAETSGGGSAPFSIASEGVLGLLEWLWQVTKAKAVEGRQTHGMPLVWGLLSSGVSAGWCSCRCR